MRADATKVVLATIEDGNPEGVSLDDEPGVRVVLATIEDGNRELDAEIGRMRQLSSRL